MRLKNTESHLIAKSSIDSNAYFSRVSKLPLNQEEVTVIEKDSPYSDNPKIAGDWLRGVG
jgi:hypothetical protein